MGFRFQKRVKVAPGIRLNISKRGVSTSIGKRGASVTLGRQGLYGNVGIPGSGLSYRKKLTSTSNRPSNTWYQKETENTLKTVSLKFDKESYSLVFVDENDERVPAAVERDIKREFASDIQKLYEQKEKEINEQTTKLLKLHKETIEERSPKELQQLANETIAFDMPYPSKDEIYNEIKTELEEGLSFFERIKLIFPSNRNQFHEKVTFAANEQFSQEIEQYKQTKAEYEEEKQLRLEQVEKVLNGDLEGMENWLESYFAELDFPLETNVSFTLLSRDTIYLDVDLPTIDEIPLTKASILKSGKLKVENKTRRETREHYAIMVGGTALYLCSYVFSLLPTCETIIISGYTQVRNDATGHLDDQYIYSLKVNRELFYSLNISEVHPIAAFENFEPIINATKTFIFKEIEPYKP